MMLIVPNQQHPDVRLTPPDASPSEFRNKK
jgi:hypothetical protein